MQASWRVVRLSNPPKHPWFVFLVNPTFQSEGRGLILHWSAPVWRIATLWNSQSKLNWRDGRDGQWCLNPNRGVADHHCPRLSSLICMMTLLFLGLWTFSVANDLHTDSIAFQISSSQAGHQTTVRALFFGHTVCFSVSHTLPLQALLVWLFCDRLSKYRGKLQNSFLI